MFDTLTLDELSRLAAKMFSGGKALADSASAIHNTMMLMTDSGKIEVDGPGWRGLVKLREPIVAAMEEAFELMTAADLTAMSKRLAVTCPGGC